MQWIARLETLGINGLFLQNIRAMYHSTKYAIKLSNGYLAPIDSNLGLKQGCPLSPMLFNLYIDDISEIFNDQCHPIEMQGTKINHFLYADDLVIISHTEEGLQTALNNLHTYSGRKYLAISVKKSKTMILNRSEVARHVVRVGSNMSTPFLMEEIWSFNRVNASSS